MNTHDDHLSEYTPILDPRETERVILKIKDHFQTNLAYELNLTRVTAPLLVRSGTGINDDLNGVEKPVRFPIKGLGGETVEIVQSLAKWKRLALSELAFEPGTGLYTDMNAIRPDEVLDETHSVYVDQWDWEKVIGPEDRSIAYLTRTVNTIYDVIRRTERFVCHEYRELTPVLPDRITFIHSEDLLQRFPDIDPREREYRVCREHGAVFVIGIGADLEDGRPHDGRAPDYDDWSTPTTYGHRGLNGDILVFNPVLDRAFELSSMGIRVDSTALRRQLQIRGNEERAELMFHRRLLAGELPLSIGGGIGQSRLSMFYLRKAHIGEIQSGLWSPAVVADLSKRNIHLL